MATYRTPGIYVEEKSTLPPSVAEVATAVPAFIGYTRNGPADTADPAGKLGGYPQLSQEALVTANPDTIFLADTKCCQQSVATVTARPGWASITAVSKKQIYALDDDIASRWGPRTVDLVQSVADAMTKVPTT